MITFISYQEHSNIRILIKYSNIELFIFKQQQKRTKLILSKSGFTKTSTFFTNLIFFPDYF